MPRKPARPARRQTTMRLRVPLLRRLDQEARRLGLARSELVERVLVGFIATTPEARRDALLWDRERPLPGSAEDVLS